eukprot:3870919-Rhodomonas_salina.1
MMRQHMNMFYLFVCTFVCHCPSFDRKAERSQRTGIAVGPDVLRLRGAKERGEVGRLRVFGRNDRQECSERHSCMDTQGFLFTPTPGLQMYMGESEGKNTSFGGHVLTCSLWRARAPCASS